MFQIWRSVHK